MGGRAGLGLRVTHSDPYALQKERKKERERERDREKQSTREREKDRKKERKKGEKRERESLRTRFVRVCAYVHVHASLTSHASACGYPPGQHKSDEPMAIP